MARKVYELDLPPTLQPGSRAASYVTAYQKGRYRLWEQALDLAKTDLALNKEDYEARRKVALELQAALRDEISDVQGALDGLSKDEIKRRQAVHQRNVAARNAARKHSASAQNSYNIATAPRTSSSTTTTLPTATGGPLEIPDAKLEQTAKAILGEEQAADVNLAVSGVLRAAGDLTIAGLADPADLAKVEALVAAAQNNYRSNVGAEPGAIEGGSDDVGAYMVGDRVITELALENGLDPQAIRERLRAGGSAGYRQGYEQQVQTIYELSGSKDTSPRQTVTQSQTTPSGGPVSYTPEDEEFLVDDDARAELEARMKRLEQELDAIDMPEMERLDLLEEARRHYVSNYGYDRLRTPEDAANRRASRRAAREPAASSPDTVERLGRLLADEGAEGLRARLVDYRASRGPKPGGDPNRPGSGWSMSDGYTDKGLYASDGKTLDVMPGMLAPTPEAPPPGEGKVYDREPAAADERMMLGIDGKDYDLTPPTLAPLGEREEEWVDELPFPYNVPGSAPSQRDIELEALDLGPEVMDPWGPGAPKPVKKRQKPDTPPLRDPFASQTPTQRDQTVRQRAAAAGATLSRDEKRLKAASGTAIGQLVRQLWASGQDAPLSHLEDQLIATYDDDEQHEALKLLHALRAENIERTMAT